MTDITGPKIVLATQAARKRRRINRELHALRTMQVHLNAKDIACAVLTIPMLALLCLAVAFKLHFASGSILLSCAAALLAGAVIWWIGRRLFTIAYLIVMALLIILFETGLDLGWPISTNKEHRHEKLKYAIARREALLRELDRAKL
ncbi:hypothetical protein [Afipia sp. DC4300-2b1]|uniref:hypothetical protein n=1 Tax=Afipia sp. DC4300-2b1 TaxID=2804672 RepID=UPI003CF5D48E